MNLNTQIKNFNNSYKKQNRKLLKLNKQLAFVFIGPRKSAFKSFTLFLRPGHTYKLTKDIDSFSIWQDYSLINLKIDKHVLKLEERFNWL